MKNLIIGIVVGALVAAGGILGMQQLFSSQARPVNMPAPAGRAGGSGSGASTGVIDLICELHLDIEGQLALGIQGNEPPRITMAQVDVDKRAGWYQGKLSISESRAGTLTVQGNKFVVTRPAMFQRFGVSINKEEFTVDRTTGAFEQSLGITDGRTVKLIKGTCAKVIKPPF
ncbi:MAG: hypothetical protein ACOVK6_00215 [Ramlibacter sp.]